LSRRTGRIPPVAALQEAPLKTTMPGIPKERALDAKPLVSNTGAKRASVLKVKSSRCAQEKMTSIPFREFASPFYPAAA
jgi:hypothetical protein